MLVLLRLEGLEVGIVDFGTHRIADGVVAGNVVNRVIAEVAHKEVLRNEILGAVERFEPRHSFTADVLKDNRLRVGAHLLAQILTHNASRRRGCYGCTLVACHGQLVDDPPREGGVLVASRWGGAKVVL